MSYINIKTMDKVMMACGLDEYLTTYIVSLAREMERKELEDHQAKFRKTLNQLRVINRLALNVLMFRMFGITRMPEHKGIEDAPILLLDFNDKATRHMGHS